MSQEQSAMSMAVGEVKKELLGDHAKRMASLLRDKVAVQKKLNAITKEIKELDDLLAQELAAFANAAE